MRAIVSPCFMCQIKIGTEKRLYIEKNQNILRFYVSSFLHSGSIK